METGDRFTVLVIDDERANLMVLNRILSPDYTVLTARSCEEGLSRIAGTKPDLILLDIIMPGMDGFEMLKTLKASPDTRSIPVIIITGLDNESDEEKGFMLGAVDYITKPFRNAIVIARVRTHLQIVSQIRMIERLGLVDPLTDIPNRRCFDERIVVEWRRAQRDKTSVAFMMIDVDRFKAYNDTYGHPQGDVLLKRLARILAAASRRPGDLAARLGGEEFGVLMPDTGLEGALEVAEEIRANVEAARIPTVDRQTVTSVTISIGVAVRVPDECGVLEDFIARADELLYAAKEGGRNRVCSDPAGPAAPPKG